MVVAEAPNARIASNAFFFTGALESDAGMEVSVNWDSNSSSAAEMSGPRLLPLDCDAKSPAVAEFVAEAPGVSMGGSEDSEKNESSSSGNGVSFCGFVAEGAGELGGLDAVNVLPVGTDVAGAGESLSVSQSSSFSSLLLSAAIPGARKFCSQCGHLTRFPAALSVIDTEPLHRGHWSDFGTAIPGRHVRIVTGKD
ncbi:MAG: hypothetical protein CMM01_09655 [Rhodopirellula sp.]|nr:hypothetical protein [Rhodopirellula sp.]